MLLPFTEPVAWNKKMKTRLMQLTDKTKDLVQSLNDYFGSYDEPIHTHYQDDSHTNYLDLSKLK